jgi:thioredoxin-like negative regulator of GroEL
MIVRNILITPIAHNPSPGQVTQQVIEITTANMKMTMRRPASSTPVLLSL